MDRQPFEMKPVEAYFEGYPQQAQLFQVVRDMIQSLGPVKVEVMKSGISFATRFKFAWVWLPQRYELQQPPGSLVLSFGLDQRIEHARIKEVANPYPQRWTHHLIINTRDDLDDTLRGWLAQAYGFSTRPGPGHRASRDI